MHILERAQEFFFEAMLEGWVGGAKGIEVAPCVWEIPYTRDDLHLTDRFLIIPGSPRSVGSTIIWHNSVPIWAMSYGGSYEERAIPLLMKALRTAYAQREFIGGRGVYQCSEGSLVYTNRPRRHYYPFASFVGREEISDEKEEILLGHHWYKGGSLL